MANLSAKLKKNKGFALIVTFLVITVLLIFAGVFVTVSISQSISANIFRRQTVVFNIAESGLDHTVFWLRSQTSPPTGNFVNPFNSGNDTSLAGGNYRVIITDLGIVGGAGGMRRYQVTSTGTLGNMTRTLTNFVQVDNFARYLWFTDRESFSGSTVWFWTQDRLNGPTQTNGHFNIMGGPTFTGSVSSSDDYIRFYNNGNNINRSATSNTPYDEPVFSEGVDFGSEPIVMPNQALNLRSAASSSGLALTGNSTVVFNSDGTMNVTNSARGWSNRNMALPANGALFVNNGNLTVSGTLNGRATVGASRDVIIPNNLEYAVDPQINPSSDDTLGIISEQDVVIDDNAPTNLNIDACIIALDSSFTLENYDDPPAKGTLTVYGGIIQDERGPVGTFNGSTGTKRSGYSKNYLYDNRLLTSPPPYMPTTGDFVTLSWEEN